MQQINLIDPRLLPPQRVMSSARLVALVAAGALAVGAHLLLERHWMAQAVAAAAPATSEAPKSAPSAADASAAAELRIAQREALRDLLLRNVEHPHDSAALVQDIVAALPDSAWLTEIDIAGARTLRISGGILEPAALGAFAERLARIPALRRVPIETLRLEPLPAVRDDAERAPAPPAHRFALASAAAPATGEAR